MQRRWVPVLWVAMMLLYYKMSRVSESRGSIEEASRYFRMGLELLVKRPVSGE